MHSLLHENVSVLHSVFDTIPYFNITQRVNVVTKWDELWKALSPVYSTQ